MEARETRLDETPRDRQWVISLDVQLAAKLCNDRLRDVGPRVGGIFSASYGQPPEDICSWFSMSPY